MKSVERLIKVREQQRDEAAARLKNARHRLAVLLAKRDALARECKSKLKRAVGNDRMTITELEWMDAARTAAHNAASSSQHQVNEEQETTLKTHRHLQQLEIWEKRIVEREKIVSKRKERRILDEVASRRNTKLFSCVLALLWMGLGINCGKNVPAPIPRADAGLKKELVECPDEKFEPEELELLRKLRKRKEQLEKEEIELLRQREENKLLREEADKTLAASRAIHDQLLGRSAPEETEMMRNLLKQEQQLKEKEQELVRKEENIRQFKENTDEALEQIREIQQQILVEAPNRMRSVDAGVRDVEAPVVVVKDAGAPDFDEPDGRVALKEVLEGMSVRQAAAMLAEMRPESAAAILMYLPPDKVASWLAQVPPEEAAAISEQLRVRKKKKRVVRETSSSDGGGSSEGETAAKEKKVSGKKQ
ncbi:MAG: hypothetical protein V1754_00145 [Pseudomonadota bacterium]